jgi:hypothetical protein
LYDATSRFLLPMSELEQVVFRESLPPLSFRGIVAPKMYYAIYIILAKNRETLPRGKQKHIWKQALF